MLVKQALPPGQPLMSPGAGLDPRGIQIDPLTATSLAGGGLGALLAEDRGYPVVDRLRGLLKGVATGSGAGLAAEMATGTGDPGLHTLGAALAGGVTSHLAATKLLELLGLDVAKEKKEKSNSVLTPLFGKEGSTPNSEGAFTPSVIQQLLLAKYYSDHKNYTRKHFILRNLINQSPEDFHIDSVEPNNIVGLTHGPTGFRIHMPRYMLPTDNDLEDRTDQAAVKIAGLLDILRAGGRLGGAAIRGTGRVLGALGEGAMATGRTLGGIGANIGRGAMVTGRGIGQGLNWFGRRMYEIPGGDKGWTRYIPLPGFRRALAVANTPVTSPFMQAGADALGQAGVANLQAGGWRKALGFGQLAGGGTLHGIDWASRKLLPIANYGALGLAGMGAIDRALRRPAQQGEDILHQIPGITDKDIENNPEIQRLRNEPLYSYLGLASDPSDLGKTLRSIAARHAPYVVSNAANNALDNAKGNSFLGSLWSLRNLTPMGFIQNRAVEAVASPNPAPTERIIREELDKGLPDIMANYDKNHASYAGQMMTRLLDPAFKNEQIQRTLADKIAPRPAISDVVSEKRLAKEPVDIAVPVPPLNLAVRKYMQDNSLSSLLNSPQLSAAMQDPRLQGSRSYLASKVLDAALPGSKLPDPRFAEEPISPSDTSPGFNYAKRQPWRHWRDTLDAQQNAYSQAQQDAMNKLPLAVRGFGLGLGRIALQDLAEGKTPAFMPSKEDIDTQVPTQLGGVLDSLVGKPATTADIYSTKPIESKRFFGWTTNKPVPAQPFKDTDWEGLKNKAIEEAPGVVTRQLPSLLKPTSEPAEGK